MNLPILDCEKYAIVEYKPTVLQSASKWDKLWAYINPSIVSTSLIGVSAISTLAMGVFAGPMILNRCVNLPFRLCEMAYLFKNEDISSFDMRFYLNLSGYASLFLPSYGRVFSVVIDLVNIGFRFFEDKKVVQGETDVQKFSLFHEKKFMRKMERRGTTDVSNFESACKHLKLREHQMGDLDFVKRKYKRLIQQYQRMDRHHPLMREVSEFQFQFHKEAFETVINYLEGRT